MSAEFPRSVVYAAACPACLVLAEWTTYEDPKLPARISCPCRLPTQAVVVCNPMQLIAPLWRDNSAVRG